MDVRGMCSIQRACPASISNPQVSSLSPCNLLYVIWSTSTRWRCPSTWYVTTSNSRYVVLGIRLRMSCHAACEACKQAGPLPLAPKYARRCRHGRRKPRVISTRQDRRPLPRNTSSAPASLRSCMVHSWSRRQTCSAGHASVSEPTTV